MDSFDLRNWPDFVKAGGDNSTPAFIDQVAIDSRRIDTSQTLFVPLPGVHCDGHTFVADAANAGAKYSLVKQDWIAPSNLSGIKLLRVPDPLEAFQTLAKCYRRQLPAIVVMIVGSYGKTMVKDLLEALLAQIAPVAASPESFNSQIGTALSLFTIQQHHQIALIEAGISQPGEMQRLVQMVEPDHGIVTHVGKKHEGTLGNLQSIAEELFRVPLSLSQAGWTLLPDAPFSTKSLSQLKAQPYFWNQSTPELPEIIPLNYRNADGLHYQVQFPDKSSFTGSIKTHASYALDLFKIVIKAAWLFGVPADKIRETLSNYVLEAMRTEIWQTPSRTTIINDTYCSDPQSVERALRCFAHHSADEGKRYFLFSGLRGSFPQRDTDYRRIGKSIVQAKVDELLLIGQHPFAALQAEVKKHSPTTAISHFKSKQAALESLRPATKPEDIILLKGDNKIPLDRVMELLQGGPSTNRCWINLAAIESNLAKIRQKQTSNTRLMVIVKALSYGTQLKRMNELWKTCGIDILGVSYVEEGIALKREGISPAVFVVNAAAFEAPQVVAWELEVGVSEPSLIHALTIEAERHQKTIKIHLHVDTGMCRFGCRPEEALHLAQTICKYPNLKLEGIFTHFSCSDDPAQDAFTLEQSKRFDEVITELKAHGIDPPWKHAANSSAAIRFAFPQYNMIRIGLATYGLYPSEAVKQAMDLRLALSLTSRIVGINNCHMGDTISYGRSYTVMNPSQRIAVLPIGYFDGLHRHYSGKGSVIIRGKLAPMVGKICMDFMMVDVTNIPEASIGDHVLIFGEDEQGNYLWPEELAASGNSIAHELITCLGPRIQRIFIHEEAQKRR